MMKQLLFTAVASMGMAAVIVCGAPQQAQAKNKNSDEHSSDDHGRGHSKDKDDKDKKDRDETRNFVLPVVFQAAGPSAASIQATVDSFRAALGNPNNGNTPGPLLLGRREINWDGGGANTTTAPVTPFDVFLNTRGGQFTTPGDGLSQAPPAGGPDDGLAGLFNNPTYGLIFTAFSPLRLFTPVDSNVTESFFFVPGSNGGIPATVNGFGAVFTDVDRQDGFTSSKKREGRRVGTLIEYFGIADDDDDDDERLLFKSFVPASPGDGSQSFFGAIFDAARISRVRITTGNVEPGRDDDRKHDVVMMDDFIYGEPQPAD